MRNKILSMLLIISLMLCLIAKVVEAVSLTVTMKPSSSSVKASTEFSVKVSVSNLDVGSNGINSLTGYLKYDDKVFEEIDESSIEGLNKWSASFDEATGKVELKKNTFVKSTQDVFQIVLKTKSSATGKTGAISFTDITASNSEEDIPASDVSVSISVSEYGDSSDENSNSTNESSNSASDSSNSVNETSDSTNESKNNTISIISNTNSNSNTSNNSSSNNTSNNSSYNNTPVNSAVGNSSNGSSNYTNTTSEDDMPKTGVSDTILSLMLILIVIALVFYIKIEKINKDIK